MAGTEPRRRAPRRRVDGVLLLDKAAGPSSNQCLGRAKWLFGAAKAGHTGTLDPFATGLLPVAFGEATKFSQGLLDADKTYAATMRLGIVTSTGDPEGEVLARAPVEADAAAVAAVLARFRGESEQVPPMHSALKRDGRPLYEYARAGLTLERAPRRIRIESIELLAFDGLTARFRVRCSKGTYVRTLAEDIGRALGCGAHLAALRREAVGALDVASARTLDAIEAMPAATRDDLLLPVDALVADLPRVCLSEGEADRLRHGQAVARPERGPGAGEPARAYDAHGRFLGLVIGSADALRPLRLRGAD
ncbi:MAG: tRNA pseudouridine(55) synthase TruB [Burkholderiales bacterium]|nr:tRNA pseudouridine(55) synthase TruB [Burkholderiales bacterium]